VLAALSADKTLVRDRLARHLICLGYVALVAGHLCRRFVRLLAPRSPIVAAGYEEGDFVMLGKLGSAGSFGMPS
jgi:hypothetical protein